MSATASSRSSVAVRPQRTVVLPTRRARIAGLFGALVVLGLCSLCSLALGSLATPLGEVIRAFTNYHSSDAHAIVRDLRVPRTELGLVVGAALGAAGALMQGTTRNPLAEPGILGINAGAAFAVVCAIRFLGVSSVAAYAVFALVGAAVAAVLVFALGASGRSGPTPVRLALAGAVLTALLVSLTSAVLVFDARTLDEFRFWVVGSLAGRDAGVTLSVLPVIVAGAAIALRAGRWLNALALGDEVARSLGQNVAGARVAAGAGFVLLAGGAVAAGPIAFVGLAVPHVARGLVGPDYRWIVPYSMVLGAILLLTSDIVGRLVVRPAELQVGVVTALVGAPFSSGSSAGGGWWRCDRTADHAAPGRRLRARRRAAARRRGHARRRRPARARRERGARRVLDPARRGRRVARRPGRSRDGLHRPRPAAAAGGHGAARRRRLRPRRRRVPGRHAQPARRPGRRRRGGRRVACRRPDRARGVGGRGVRAARRAGGRARQRHRALRAGVARRRAGLPRRAGRIGVAAFAQAGISYVLTQGGIFEVSQAYVWLVGSLNARGWVDAWPLAAALVALTPAMLALGARADVLALGDEVARGLRVGVERTRLLLLGAAVVLTGVAVSSAGPIGFVAFIAPHISRRLARPAGARGLLLTSAACGALQVLVCDLVGRLLFSPTEIPVGIVTSVIAAPYFLLLLRRAHNVGVMG